MTKRQSIITIVKLLLFYVVYQLGFSAVCAGLARLIPMSPGTMVSLAMVASTIVMTWHLIRFGYVHLADDRYKEVSPSVLGVSVVFIFSATYVLNLLIEQAHIPDMMEDTFMDMSRNPFGILSIGLLAPILEELLFRGAIQGCLQQTLKSSWAAIIMASLIFGIVHMNPAQIPFAFLMGTIFGWLYYRTGSLLPGIVGHVLNNSIATLNMLLYGNATIEEQVESPTTMWFVALVSTILFAVTARWLHRALKR